MTIAGKYKSRKCEREGCCNRFVVNGKRLKRFCSAECKKVNRRQFKLWRIPA